MFWRIRPHPPRGFLAKQGVSWHPQKIRFSISRTKYGTVLHCCTKPSNTRLTKPNVFCQSRTERAAEQIDTKKILTPTNAHQCPPLSTFAHRTPTALLPHSYRIPTGSLVAHLCPPKNPYGFQKILTDPRAAKNQRGNRWHTEPHSTLARVPEWQGSPTGQLGATGNAYPQDGTSWQQLLPRRRA
jgi:hypothetical protein